jgi:hypothetical protein
MSFPLLFCRRLNSPLTAWRSNGNHDILIVWDDVHLSGICSLAIENRERVRLLSLGQTLCVGLHQDSLFCMHRVFLVYAYSCVATI